MAVNVDGHGAHSAARVRGIEQLRVVAAPVEQLLPALLGAEVARIDLRETLLHRKLVGAFARQHDVWRLLHDRASEADGIASSGHPGHGAGLAGRPVHDRGVEFVAPVGREYRATAGVEQRIVLEHADRGFDGVEARTTAAKYRRSRVHGREQRRAIGDFLFRRQITALDDARAAMDGQRPGLARVSGMSRHEHGANTQQQRKESAQRHGRFPLAPNDAPDYARTVDAAPRACLESTAEVHHDDLRTTHILRGVCARGRGSRTRRRRRHRAWARPRPEGHARVHRRIHGRRPGLVRHRRHGPRGAGEDRRHRCSSSSSGSASPIYCISRGSCGARRRNA